ncbi:MAG: hypothetical protein KGV46_03045 [Pasteurella sp.]|nr:hypothetical protein [Pasteurella sp.]
MFPRFDFPLKDNGYRECELLYSEWSEATEAYERKEYKAVVYHLLRFINQNVAGTLRLNKKDIHIEIKHSCMLLDIKVNDDEFKIKAPFLTITEQTNVIALLRKISELNFNALMLPQIILEDDLLYFSYSCPLELCEPAKILAVIREICYQGDYHSPRLKENYQTDYFINPSKRDLTTNEKDKVFTSIKKILDDYDNCMAFFEKERLSEYHWDIVTITLLKFENMPYLNGVLRSDLLDITSLMYSDNHTEFKVDRGMAFIKELKEKSTQEFLDSMYYQHTFYTRLMNISQETLKEELEKNKERFEKSKKEGRYFALTYDIYERLLKIIYEYNIDDKTRNMIYKGLNQIKRNTDFEEAAMTLYNLYNDLVKGKQYKKMTIWAWIQIIAVFYFITKILIPLIGK